MKELALVLRNIRELNDLTQEELAKKLKIARSFLSEVESCKKPVSLNLLDRYAKAFGIKKSKILAFAEALEK